MMKLTARIGRFGHTNVLIHASWPLVFVLLSFTLAVVMLPQEFPHLSSSAYWGLAVVTGLLFFGSMLMHEYAHVYAARRRGIFMRAITLLPLGGVYRVSQRPNTPRQALYIAAAGPLVNLSLALFFEGEWWLNEGIVWLAAPAVWLARLNLIAALLNLLPVPPLDGGRLWQAVAWLFNSRRDAIDSFTYSFLREIMAASLLAAALFALMTKHYLLAVWLGLGRWLLPEAHSVKQELGCGTKVGPPVH